MTASLNRREALASAGAALAGSSAAVLAACGGGDGGTSTPGPGTGAPLAPATEPEPRGTAGARDVALLNGALDIENMAIAAYDAALPHVRGPARTLALQFQDQEREHADALAEAIRQLGGTPSKPKPAYSFPRLRGQAGTLRFASGIEDAAITAYMNVLPRLTSPDLRGTAAAIASVEAEHLAVLQGELGRPQLPQAFVTGAG
jgi:rubrerythrin